MGLYYRNSVAADRVFIGPSDRVLFIACPGGPLSEFWDGVLRVVLSRACASWFMLMSLVFDGK